MAKILGIKDFWFSVGDDPEKYFYSLPEPSADLEDMAEECLKSYYDNLSIFDVHPPIFKVKIFRRENGPCIFEGVLSLSFNVDIYCYKIIKKDLKMLREAVMWDQDTSVCTTVNSGWQHGVNMRS